MSMRIFHILEAVIVWVRVTFWVRVRVLLTCCSCAHSPYVHLRNMQTPCRKKGLPNSSRGLLKNDSSSKKTSKAVVRPCIALHFHAIIYAARYSYYVGKRYSFVMHGWSPYCIQHHTHRYLPIQHQQFSTSHERH